MKIFKLSLTLMACVALQKGHAQQMIGPGNSSIQHQWIKNKNSSMTWYLLKDTSKTEIGKIKKNVVLTSKTLTIISQVSLQRSSAPWIDSTIADPRTLMPVKHASYNQQRDMVLNFGTLVTGYYLDKTSNNKTTINMAIDKPYFDSNIYPDLIQWLPLTKGYTAQIPIYDYNPGGTMGVVSADVTGVTDGLISSAAGRPEPVWVVAVTDGISKANSIFYIAKSDRTVIKVEIDFGGRKMLMEGSE